MDQNTEKAFEEITKAIRPEITKEQLGMVIEHLMEAIEGMIEMPEEEDSEEESDSAEMEVEDANSSNPNPVGDPAKNEVNWPVAKSNDEDSMDYESDNEEEDKWDNIAKACWSGYTQRGMKDKNGRMVPNCVPVEKAEDLSEADQVKKSFWGDTFFK